MTVFVTPFQRAGRLTATLVVSCLVFLLGAQSVSAQIAPSSNRFLFIIDTSSSMKPFDKGIQDSLFDLIYSGARGHMTNGDTYGVWLVNEENDMSFKMETWRQKFTVEMGARAALHVKEHGFKGKLDLAQAMDDALAVIRNVGDLTIILISNGETPLSRTPFDDAINARFRELAPLLKRKKATLNTVLAAQDGKLIAWSVNSPDYLIEFPYVPPKPKPVKPAIVATPVTRPTNVSPTVVAAAPARMEPVKARANVTPIIITKDTVAQERRHFLALASTLTNEPGASAAVTNPLPNQTSETATTAVVTTNIIAGQTNPAVSLITTSVVELKTVAVGSVPTAKATTASQTNHPSTNVVAMLTKSAVTNSAVTTGPAPVPPAPTATASPAPSQASASEPTEVRAKSHPLLWVAIGAGAAVVVMLSVLMVLRTRRPEPSLVSRAIIRERMRTS